MRGLEGVGEGKSYFYKVLPGRRGKIGVMGGGGKERKGIKG